MGGWLPDYRRILTHEWTLATLACLVLALLLNLGGLVDPRHTIAGDLGDPSLQAYTLAWTGHALISDPANIWQINAFYPDSYGLAFTDSLLGYAPLNILGTGTEATLLKYNLIFIFAQFLVFLGGYALARQLGAGRAGSALASVAITMAPWRLDQQGHLHILSSGGITLALAMLARGHGMRLTKTEPAQPTRKRPGWIVAGWLVAAWQVSIGFGIGLVFAYVLFAAAAVSAVLWWRRHRSLPPRPVLIANAVGGLIFGAVALYMALPYLTVLDLYPYARRTPAYVDYYSPPIWGYAIAPRVSWLWGQTATGVRSTFAAPSEMSLLSGFALYGFAIAGMSVSIWSKRVRRLLGLGVLVSGLLSLGTNGIAHGQVGYMLLYRLPGFEGLRTPGRLVLWTTIFLALLAAGWLSEAQRRLTSGAWLPGARERMGALTTRLLSPGRPVSRAGGAGQPARVWAAVTAIAVAIPVLLVGVEGLGTVGHPAFPQPPRVLASVPAPYLILPSDQLQDMVSMVWSTDGFGKMVNGGSGFVPAELDETRKVTAAFPNRRSVEYLRGIGVNSVVVLRGMTFNTPWDNAERVSIDGLGITRQVTPEAVVFLLNPPAATR